MTTYLITVSLGPVQGLIAAARRTRDLWCGSWVLSEAARAAARVLHHADPEAQPLIFPFTSDPDRDLKPKTEPGDEANIANILRAQIDLAGPGAAAKLCKQAKEAAENRVRDLGEQAKQRLALAPKDPPLRQEVWDAQIGDIIECFSAWVPIHGNDYAAAGKRLGRVLNERKATRNFAPAPVLATQGLPKSSLDGARETVLPNWPLQHPARRKLGLGQREQLDALGVIKRMAVGAEQFTPYSRIAADAWIRDLSPGQRARIAEHYEPIRALDLATRCTGNGDIYNALPYDGELLFDFRLQNAIAQHRGWYAEAEARFKRLSAALIEIAKARDADGQSIGAPVPYAAIVKGDGDHMGRLLSQARTVEDSRAISKALHDFASSVRRIVRDHCGHAIYAGGDDVLAMVPLISAQDCARKLADQYRERMQGVVRELALDIPADEQPTLSVGIAIGHVMEPLGALRHRAEQAEQLAKGDNETRPRNALAIQLGIRSGGEYRWRARWDDMDAQRALTRLTAGFIAGQLPSRIAYDLGAIDRRLGWLRDDDSDEARGMREAEVLRALDRARAEGGSQPIPPDLQRLLRTEAKTQGLGRLADTLIIARWLAARRAADIGED